MRKVEVAWVDSHEMCGWVMLDELPEYYDKNITTIGIEVERSDDGIVVASSVDEETSQVCGAMFIPAKSIHYVRYLMEENQ